MGKRLAIAVAVLCIAGLGWAAFAPTSSVSGGPCGSLYHPHWTSERFIAAGAPYMRGSATAETRAAALELAAEKNSCDSALSGRKSLAWLFFGGAVVGPLLVRYVAGKPGRQPRIVDAMPT